LENEGEKQKKKRLDIKVERMKFHSASYRLNVHWLPQAALTYPFDASSNFGTAIEALYGLGE
jgi:hypothetical protein